jgi:HEAT repeat protein
LRFLSQLRSPRLLIEPRENKNVERKQDMKRWLYAMPIVLVAATPTWAYLAAMPTLGKITVDSRNIVVLQVDKVNRDKQVVIFKKVADLKGKDLPEVVKHKLTDGFHPRQARIILDWAEPGQIAICFQNGERTCVTCIGGFWYECSVREVPWWIMTTGRAELSYAYSGSTAKLRDHVTALLAGRETIITALEYRVFVRMPGPQRLIERKREHWDANEAVCARRLMRGQGWPVCRIRASLKMPNTVPELIRDTDLIVGVGPGSQEDVPTLIKALTHEGARIRIEAAEDLGQIGPPALAAMPALLKMAEQDRDPVFRVEAAKAVASIDLKNEAALPMLVEALRDKAGKVRKRAAECIGDLGPRARSAVAGLLKALKDPDPAVSWAAADALGQIGPHAQTAVPGLIEALDAANTRGAAVDALGQIGRNARQAIPALEKVVKGDDVTIRWAAASALVRIGGPGLKTGVRYLLETASHNRERNWTDAYNILMAPTAREALPALLDAVRDAAIREIAWETAVDSSIYLTKDPLADVKGFLEDKDAGVRCVAAWALHCARAVELKTVIAVQVETLKAPDPWARRQAARFLGRLGPYGKEAAPALSAALQDRDEGVRKAAAEALPRIQQKQ